MAASLTIGRLAQRAGVNVESVRFYQRRGLLAEPPRPLGGIRRYGDDDVRRIRFIRQSQTLGFTLAEVAELLALDDGRHCSEAQVLAAGKLAVVRERIVQLRRIERLLAGLVTQCRCNTGAVRCPLIEGMHDLSVPPPVPRQSGAATGPEARAPRAPGKRQRH
jgi:MerR family mercuric resistance operon transcriptional regulator